MRALAQGTCELMWLKRMLKKLRISSSGPMRLFCDNKAAISGAHNPVHHDWTKHVEIDRHFLKEKIEEGTICMIYILALYNLQMFLQKGCLGMCLKIL